MSLNGYLIIIVVGALAGLLADAMLGGVRLGGLGAIVIGILGAFLGNWVFDRLNLSLPGSQLFISIATAFLGAIILLLLLRGLRRA